MNYPGIRIEGAILSPDILERLEDAAGQQAADFGFDRSARVKDEIARAWADAQDYWRIPVADGGDFRRGDGFFALRMITPTWAEVWAWVCRSGSCRG